MAPASRVFLVALALVGWLWSGWALAAGLTWGLALRCDEACDGGGWRRSPDAWQWKGVAGLGVVAFLAGTALLLSVWRRRAWYAAASLLLGLVAVLLLATALSPEWPEHLGRRSPGELAALAAGLVAPIAAVALAATTNRVEATRRRRLTDGR